MRRDGSSLWLRTIRRGRATGAAGIGCGDDCAGRGGGIDWRGGVGVPVRAAELTGPVAGGGGGGSRTGCAGGASSNGCVVAAADGSGAPDVTTAPEYAGPDEATWKAWLQA